MVDRLFLSKNAEKALNNNQSKGSNDGSEVKETETKLKEWFKNI